MQYNVEVAYTINEWATITVDADDENEARELGLKEFEMTWPEANDIEVLEVNQIG